MTAASGAIPHPLMAFTGGDPRNVPQAATLVHRLGENAWWLGLGAPKPQVGLRY